MKLAEMIANLDKSDQNEYNMVWDLEQFRQELDIAYFDAQQDQDNPRLRGYWMANHYCTDTYVGFRAYFLDDTFVCLSSQPARKSDEYFQWVSDEAQVQVRDYILSLRDEDEFEYDSNHLDMNEDWDDGYPVQYVGQLLTKEVLYQRSLVKVVKEESMIDGEYNFHTITIEKDGENIDCDIRDILVPWKVN
ncbi:catalase-like domain protein [Vibrio phage 1.081.O._10N.286.52.C2]|nr:catalase-like domain protein [Vibrio phage 1.081.O._10N.286.52.C2]